MSHEGRTNLYHVRNILFYFAKTAFFNVKIILNMKKIVIRKEILNDPKYTGINLIRMKDR